MRLPLLKQPGTGSISSLYIKCSAIFLLFLFSVLIAACGSNASGVGLGQPQVTETINLDGGSPTPPMSNYYCTVWLTSTTPGINTGGVIPVYAKFVQLVNNNPQGIDQASAVATVQWADGSIVNVSATTTADGLAVFPVSTANRGADVGHFSFVSVAFSKANTPGCSVTGSQAAFFMLIYATPQGTATPSVTTTPGGTPCVPAGHIVGVPVKKTPTPIPTPSPTPIPSPTPCQ